MGDYPPTDYPPVNGLDSRAEEAMGTEIKSACRRCQFLASWEAEKEKACTFSLYVDDKGARPVVADSKIRF